jgi:hypothetical protein
MELIAKLPPSTDHLKAPLIDDPAADPPPPSDPRRFWSRDRHGAGGA